MTDNDDDQKTEGETTPEDTADAKTDWRARLERSLEEVKALGAQVGRELDESTEGARHEVKETWKKIQPKIGEAEAKLREAAEGAKDQLETMFGELRQSLRSRRKEP